MRSLRRTASGMIEEISCGAVLYIKRDALKYLVILDRNGNYGFPKGHMEKGETEKETALREIKEEAGVEVTLVEGFRHTVSYLIREGTVRKSVHCFLGTFKGEPFINDGEAREIRLLEYEEALELLSFDATKELLKEAHEYLMKSIGEG